MPACMLLTLLCPESLQFKLMPRQQLYSRMCDSLPESEVQSRPEHHLNLDRAWRTGVGGRLKQMWNAITSLRSRVVHTNVVVGNLSELVDQGKVERLETNVVVQRQGVSLARTDLEVGRIDGEVEGMRVTTAGLKNGRIEKRIDDIDSHLFTQLHKDDLRMAETECQIEDMQEIFSQRLQ